MMLICPKCKNPLIKVDHSYKCENGHCFDIAKRGYVNLVLGSSKGSGDDKEMVRSRTAFLNRGYYANLREYLSNLVTTYGCSTIVDAGCGEGYYTNYLKQQHPFMELCGFDLSKYAIDEACKAHAGVTYGVCNIFHLPIADEYCDGVLSVFAPIDEVENKRVLKTGGIFIKVGPGPKHLWELKQELYKDVYENEIENGYDEFELIQEEILDDKICINQKEDIWSLFQMTPYYWRTKQELANHLKELDQLTVTTEFHITVYRKK